MSLAAPRYQVWYHDWRQWKNGKYTETKGSFHELPWVWDSHTQERIIAPDLYKTYSERSQWAHKRAAIMNNQIKILK